MASQVPFEEHRKLLMFLAHKVKGRMLAAGAKSVQFEDIFQELVCAWCVARDKWEESHGVPFGAYLTRGALNHINAWVKKELHQKQIAPIDLDAEFSEEADGTLHDVLADKLIPSPEDVLIQDDMRDYAMSPIRWRDRGPGWVKRPKVSPTTTKFIELMNDPPVGIIQIFHGLKARAEYARNTLKISSVCAPKRITGALILDVMGVARGPDRAAIYSEIERLCTKVSQQ